LVTAIRVPSHVISAQVIQEGGHCNESKVSSSPVQSAEIKEELNDLVDTDEEESRGETKNESDAHSKYDETLTEVLSKKEICDEANTLRKEARFDTYEISRKARKEITNDSGRVQSKPNQQNSIIMASVPKIN